jgi:hypothetical protein
MHEHHNNSLANKTARRSSNAALCVGVACIALGTLLWLRRALAYSLYPSGMNSYFGKSWWMVWPLDREHLQHYASRYVGTAALVGGAMLVAFGIAIRQDAYARRQL